jgi:hypothetical protein
MKCTRFGICCMDNSFAPDWLPLLLSSLNAETKVRVLLLVWRAWHMRNNVMHGGDTATIMGSAPFLKSYSVSLNIASQCKQTGQDTKGKGTIF